MVLLLALCALGAPARAAPQVVDPLAPSTSERGAEARVAVTNALLGGVSAGVARVLSGGSFLEGFEKGLAGGTLHWLGKRIVASDFDGRWIVGRQVAALGTSIVANAGAGRGTFERLYFPFGPFALEYDAAGRHAFRPSVDLYDVARIASAATNPRYRLDWGTSLRMGTTVFQGSDRVLHERGMDGATGGSVVHVEEATPAMREQILDHEMVHVLQRELINRAWFYPAEQRLIGAALRGRSVPGRIRLGLLYPLVRSGLRGIGPLSPILRPLEAEAEFMEWRGRS